MLFVVKVKYNTNHIFYTHYFYIVLPPISTETIQEESAGIEKLATDCRQQMLDVLKDITPIETVKKTQ